jgi:histone H3/H4
MFLYLKPNNPHMQKKLPSLVMDNLLKKAGIRRIGESAKEALSEAMDRKIQDVTRKAKGFCSHAGRKTVTKEDIMLSITP